MPRTRRQGGQSTKLRHHMSTVRTKQKSNLELGQVCILLMSTLSDIFSLAWTYVLNFAMTGDQIFKYLSLWQTFLIQTTTVSQFLLHDWKDLSILFIQA